MAHQSKKEKIISEPSIETSEVQRVNSEEHTARAVLPNKSNRGRFVLLTAVLTIFSLVVLGVLFMRFSTNYDQKLKVMRSLRLPVAVVGTQKVSLADYEKILEETKKAATNEQSNQDIAKTRKDVYDNLILNKKIENFVQQKNIAPSNAEIDAEYSLQQETYSPGDAAGFEKMLRDQSNVSIAEFKNLVVRPNVNYSKLSKWFFEQKDLQPEIYATVDTIKTELDKGVDFGELARKYSEDEATKEFNGDAGTVSEQSLPPEMKEKIANTEPGKYTFFTTANGLFFVKVVSADKANPENIQYNLKVIYLAGKNPYDWIKTQTDSIKVYNLLRLQ